MVLEQEQQYFESHKNDLLKQYKGQFVLIKGVQLVGAFPDAERAYSDGLDRFGIEPFLVKQVLEEEPVGFAPIMSFVPHAGI